MTNIGSCTVVCSTLAFQRESRGWGKISKIGAVRRSEGILSLLHLLMVVRLGGQ